MAGVIGDLELSGVAISSQLVLQQVVFTGDVNFGQARFERSVDLTGCRFERKLIFADAIVSGTLTLDDVQIGSPSEKCRHRSQDRLTESTDSLPKQKTVAEFNSVRVTGSFSLMHSRVFGSLSCEYAKIDGGFWLDETFVAGSMSLRNSGFSELRTDKKTHSCLDPTNTGESDVVPFEIGGNIDLTGAAVGGDVRLIGVVIGGDLKMQTARIQGGILCRSAADLKESGRSEIGGKAWLLGVETGADVDFSGTYIRGDLIIENARVRQNVWAISRGGFSSQVDGNISLWGSHISGSSIFSGVYCRGNLALDGASIGFNLVVALDIDVRNLEIVMATVVGCITAEAAKIGQNVVLMGLEVGKHCGSDTARANFVGARIDGELTLYREAYIDDILDALKYDSEKKLVSKEAKETAKKKALRTRSVISGNMKIARSRVTGGVVHNGV